MNDDVYNLIISRRTIRKFKQKMVEIETLKKLVNAARLAPSMANLQPLEYVIVNNPETCEKIFNCLRWAGYISPNGTPKDGEKPVAYIVVLANENINSDYKRDVGAAIENMIIAALSFGIGSCWLCNIDREKIRSILKIPDKLLIDSVLALGYPGEKPVVEPLEDSVKYWKDEKGVLHVPKRNLDEMIHVNEY